jgi:hypothetical protein
MMFSFQISLDFNNQGDATKPDAMGQTPFSPAGREREQLDSPVCELRFGVHG